MHFKEAFLKVENGLHVVRGHNKSSKNKNQSNGAGKSLLFSPIANVFVGSPPIISKKKNKADLLQKNSCAYLDFITHDKRRVEIYQYDKRYDIFENTSDLQITTSSKAEKQIHEYFPLNEQEFYSTCYLTTQMHPFQIASPNDRLKFISDLFRLHDYDILKKHFSQKLRAIKDSETEHRTLLTEYTRTEQQLKRLTWTLDSQQELNDYRAKLESVSSKIKDIQEELLRYSKMGIVHGQYSGLLKKLKAVGKITDPVNRLKKLRQIHDQCVAYEEYVRDFDAYTKNVEKLKHRIKEIETAFTEDEAHILYKNAAKEFKEIEDRLEFLVDQELEWSTVTEQQKMLKQKLSKVELIETDKEQVLTRKYEAQSILSLEKLLTDNCDGNVKCPTCKSDFEVKALKKVIAKAQTEFDYCAEQLTAIDLYKKYNELVVPKYNKVQHEKLREEYKSYKTHVINCETQLENARQKQAFIATLEQIESLYE